MNYGHQRQGMNRSVRPNHMARLAVGAEAEMRSASLRGGVNVMQHAKKPEMNDERHRDPEGAAEWDGKGGRMVEGVGFRGRVYR